ncbi:MAG: VUT family protein, partial [Candidatus Amulumruptor sp.]|nr:VUT family protein [Candidatus Amulumruptor sp.]
VMHRASGGARGFSLRAVVSTLVGESIDSAIFFPIAFGGNLPWSVIVTLMITQAVTKTLYEILVLPLTILIVKRMRRFNPLPHELY